MLSISSFGRASVPCAEALSSLQWPGGSSLAWALCCMSPPSQPVSSHLSEADHVMYMCVYIYIYIYVCVCVCIYI